MKANVIITVGENGKDIPKEVIEAINCFMRSNFKTVCATLVVNDVEYTIDYNVIEEGQYELS